MSDSIRVAIFGNGFARKVILPCLRRVEGIRPVGLSSPNLERARRTAEEFGIGEVADDHRRILESTRPDLVFVVTPPHRHAEMVIDALKAGCHVVCEKPMALDATETRRMLEQAKARPERLALIDHELRFHPGRVAVRERIRAGRYGAILQATYRLHSSGRRDPSHPWSWWSDASQGGGALGAIGSHAIDSLRVLLGEIVSVRGNLDTLIRERPDPHTGHPRPVSSDDHCSAWFRFRSGTRAAVSISMIEVDRIHRIRLVGTEGAAELDEQSPPRSAEGLGRLEELPVAWPVPTCAELRIPETDWARCFLIFARRIVEALRRGETAVPGAATFEEGHRTQLVIDAIRRSSNAEEWIAAREEPDRQ